MLIDQFTGTVHRVNALDLLRSNGLTPAGLEALQSPTSPESCLIAPTAPDGIISLDVIGSTASSLEQVACKVAQVIGYVEEINSRLEEVGSSTYLMVAKIPGDGIEIHTYGTNFAESNIAMLALTIALARDEEIANSVRRAVDHKQDDWQTTIIMPLEEEQKIACETQAPSIRRAASKVAKEHDCWTRIPTKSLQHFGIDIEPDLIEAEVAFFSPEKVEQALAQHPQGERITRIIDNLKPKAVEFTVEQVPHSFFIMVQNSEADYPGSEAAYLVDLSAMVANIGGDVVIDQNDPKQVSGAIVRGKNGHIDMDNLFIQAKQLADTHKRSVKIGIGPSSRVTYQTAQHGKIPVMFNKDGAFAAKLKTDPGLYIVSAGMVPPRMCEVSLISAQTGDGKNTLRIQRVDQLDPEHPIYLDPTPENRKRNAEIFYGRNFHLLPLLAGYASSQEFLYLLKTADFHGLEHRLRGFSQGLAGGSTTKGIEGVNATLTAESPNYLGERGIAVFKFVLDNFKFGIGVDTLAALTANSDNLGMDANELEEVLNKLRDTGQVIAVDGPHGRIIIPHWTDSKDSDDLIEQQPGHISLTIAPRTSN